MFPHIITANHTDVKNIIYDVTSRHNGYSGWCQLNEAGDRYTSNYDIWDYGIIDMDPSFIHYGTYYAPTGEVNWN